MSFFINVSVISGFHIWSNKKLAYNQPRSSSTQRRCFAKYLFRSGNSAGWLDENRHRGKLKKNSFTRTLPQVQLMRRSIWNLDRSNSRPPHPKWFSNALFYRRICLSKPPKEQSSSAPAPIHNLRWNIYSGESNILENFGSTLPNNYRILH